jgi:hypothetical protein
LQLLIVHVLWRPDEGNHLPECRLQIIALHHVEEIVRLLDEGKGIAELARSFKVHTATIYRLQNAD